MEIKVKAEDIKNGNVGFRNYIDIEINNCKEGYVEATVVIKEFEWDHYYIDPCPDFVTLWKSIRKTIDNHFYGMNEIESEGY